MPIMPDNFTGKVALATEASRGIGRRIHLKKRQTPPH
jgi:hypothetical protein